jgi:hypothetical protein
MSAKLIVIDMDGHRFVAPAEIIPLLSELRPLTWDYQRSGGAYYFLTPNPDVVVRIVDASTIEPCKRVTPPAPAPIVVTSQYAVVEPAPSPEAEPVRDFVHEYRDPADDGCPR